jgi:hypothetical protein
MGTLLLKIGLSAIIIVITSAIHAWGMMITLNIVRMTERARKPRILRKTPIFLTNLIVIMMFLVSIAEVLIWACAYLMMNAINGIEKAVYFSMVTFTTLGYGDVLLDERWRLLASFEAANGIIMFGWTTAIVIAAVQRLYFRV